MKYAYAQKNSMFPPEMTAFIRFVVDAVESSCPVCGNKVEEPWTMAVPFYSADMQDQKFQVSFPDQIFEALTPVCRDHVMKPAEPFYGEVLDSYMYLLDLIRDDPERLAAVTKVLHPPADDAEADSRMVVDPVGMSFDEDS